MWEKKKKQKCQNINLINYKISHAFKSFTIWCEICSKSCTFLARQKLSTFTAVVPLSSYSSLSWQQWKLFLAEREWEKRSRIETTMASLIGACLQIRFSLSCTIVFCGNLEEISQWTSSNSTLVDVVSVLSHFPYFLFLMLSLWCWMSKNIRVVIRIRWANCSWKSQTIENKKRLWTDKKLKQNSVSEIPTKALDQKVIHKESSSSTKILLDSPFIFIPFASHKLRLKYCDMHVRYLHPAKKSEKLSSLFSTCTYEKLSHLKSLPWMTN